MSLSTFTGRTPLEVLPLRPGEIQKLKRAGYTSIEAIIEEFTLFDFIEGEGISKQIEQKVLIALRKIGEGFPELEAKEERSGTVPAVSRVTVYEHILPESLVR